MYFKSETPIISRQEGSKFGSCFIPLVYIAIFKLVFFTDRSHAKGYSKKMSKFVKIRPKDWVLNPLWINIFMFKVRIFWEGHKTWEKWPNFFWTYLVTLINLRDFFQFLWPFQNTYTMNLFLFSFRQSAINKRVQKYDLVNQTTYGQ